ncbi:MAG TPA: MarR family transcriptional regulator [Acidimicrobiia bacterium]|jgi:MarR family transcriptional regulator for hemolysin
MVPDPSWDIGEDSQVVGRALAFTGKIVSGRFVETLARCGGSLPAWSVLLSLALSGPISQRELAGRIHVEGATVTYHLDRLEAAGLVTRQRDPGDRRVWRAELTDAGRETFRRMKHGALAFETALRAGLDDAELAHFFDVLERLTKNAEAFDPGSLTSTSMSSDTSHRPTDIREATSTQDSTADLPPERNA